MYSREMVDVIERPISSKKHLNRLLVVRYVEGRVARSLSHQTVAEYLGISAEQVAAIEVGDRMLSTADIILLADLFEVKPDWFYDF